MGDRGRTIRRNFRLRPVDDHGSYGTLLFARTDMRSFVRVGTGVPEGEAL
jgi:hypothetical protein